MSGSAFGALSLMSQVWSCATLQEGTEQVMAEAADAAQRRKDALLAEEEALLLQIQAQS